MLTGLCGTDLHIYLWDEWAARTIPVPLAIGHEFVGEIVALGVDANDFAVGDLVSGEGHVICGRCRNCLAGRRHLCAHTQGVGVTRAGAFAEFISLQGTSGGTIRPSRQRETSIAEAQTKLGMQEGFDVGLEMSGNEAAFKEMLANMSHAAKIAMLGIPPKEMSIDWSTVIFHMITIKGIYGREMYETWYKMTVMLESGLDITPVITHRFSYKDFEAGFAAMQSGRSGKVLLDWSSES